MSLETHYTVENTHTHTKANPTQFPPIVIAGNTKRSTTCDFKRVLDESERSHGTAHTPAATVSVSVSVCVIASKS